MSEVLKVKELTTELAIGRECLTAVDRVSFSLEKGKTLALVGESGCGKSLTALSILRILPRPPSLQPKGEVWLDGVNLLALSERQMRKIRGSKIAMIFQDPMSALNPVYSIGDQLLEVVDDEDRVLEALDEVGISDPIRCFEAFPHQLSGGMKQRAMIAMALLGQPDVLIADEPTTALDVTVQKQVLELMQELQRKKGMAILLITHDMGVVAQIADEVAVMYASQIVERGSVQEVFQKRAHPYTEALFQSLPGKEKGRLKTIQGSVPGLSELPLGCHFHPRCPHVMTVCQKKEPNMFQVDGNHCSKCFLRDPDREKVNV